MLPDAPPSISGIGLTTQTEAGSVSGTQTVVFLEDRRKATQSVIRNPSREGTGTLGLPVDANTKDYLDAKVDAVKAQNDARFAEVMSALGGLKTEMTAQSEVARARFETTAAELTITREAAIAAKTAAASAEAAAGTTKWNILFTGLTVLALIVGVWSIWGQAIEMTVGILGQASAPEASVPAPAASEP